MGYEEFHQGIEPSALMPLSTRLRSFSMVMTSAPKQTTWDDTAIQVLILQAFSGDAFKASTTTTREIIQWPANRRPENIADWLKSLVQVGLLEKSGGRYNAAYRTTHAGRELLKLMTGD
jgi:predicted transcriptional regulator